jgi:hypothetical protein
MDINQLENQLINLSINNIKEKQDIFQEKYNIIINDLTFYWDNIEFSPLDIIEKIKEIINIITNIDMIEHIKEDDFLSNEEDNFLSEQKEYLYNILINQKVILKRYYTEEKRNKKIKNKISDSENESLVFHQQNELLKEDEQNNQEINNIKILINQMLDEYNHLLQERCTL